MQTSFRLEHIILDELRCKKDIESYDCVMEQHPNYPMIWWYNLRHKSKGKIRIVQQ